MIRGDSHVYAVLGHPVAHSLSPPMHNAAFKDCGLNAVYVAFDVEPDDLMAVLHSMQAMGVRGCNLTVPLKEVAFEGLNDLDDAASRLGAVNTVRFSENGMRGYNTDGVGFLRALEADAGCQMAGRDVFIAGMGGSGRAIAITCAMQGAGRLTLASRTGAKCERVRDEVAQVAPDLDVRIVDGKPSGWIEASREADLVVNATPLGMKAEEGSVLPAEAFRDGQIAYDLIYMTPETAFTRAATTGGAQALNGLGMLLYQGVEAFEIWFEQDAPVAIMRDVLRENVYSGRRNV